MLVVLKIPIVYLCVVVWWAIRAEPETEAPPDGVRAAPVDDTPLGPSGPVWRRMPGSRPGPSRRPARARPRDARIGAVR
jgi:hypothetical protein